MVPFFGYEPYCFAELFAVIGCIATLYQRFIMSACLLAISVISHPVIGLYGCIFAAATALPEWRQLLTLRVFVGLVIFIVVVLTWLSSTIPSSALGNTKMPNESWIKLVKIMNYHVFPILRGVISFNSYNKLFPFIASSILLFYYLTLESMKDELVSKVFNGCMVLFVLSILGIFLPLTNNPFLIKIALTRASVFLLFFSVIYISYGLFKDSLSERPLLSFIAAVLIIFPFVSRDGFSIYWVMAFCLLSGRFSDFNKRSSLLLMVSLAILLITTLGYCYLGYAGPSKFGLNIFKGQDNLTKVVLLVYLIGVLLLRDKVYRKYFLISGISIIVILNLYQQHTTFTRYMGLEKLQAYKETQLWARENTKPNSLFMIPPGPYTGWIDFAHRPSVGTTKLWLQDGWFYHSSYPVYKSGIERISKFNIHIKNYTNRFRGIKGYHAILRDSTNKYYASDLDWFQSWVDEYKVDYFVFENSKMKVNLAMDKVFENKYFSVLKPKK